MVAYVDNLRREILCGDDVLKQAKREVRSFVTPVSVAVAKCREAGISEPEIMEAFYNV